MDSFSVLIPSYKERERLYNLVKKILSDRLSKKIDKIIIVSPDKSLSLPQSKKIVLIKEKVRRGKYFAIRLGLKKIRTKFVVMLSSDLIMRKNFLQYLIKPLENPEVGMVVGRPMADKNSRIYPFSRIIWDLHHLLCLEKPKGTEICSFKKIFSYFPEVSADEVFIEYKIRRAGYKVVYEPKAFGFTKIPESLTYFFKQRKRINVGHIQIKSEYKFFVSSLNFLYLLKILFKFFLSKKASSYLLLSSSIVLLLEFMARLIALIEFYIFEKKYLTW